MFEVRIIPKPQIILVKEGQGITCSWNNEALTSLAIAKDLCKEPELVKAKYGFELVFGKAGNFWLKQGITKEFAKKQGYLLRIKEGKVFIAADTEQGQFYALQTLAQIMATATENDIPELEIIDWPSLEMRGFNVCYHMVTEYLPMLGPNYKMLIQLIEEFAHFKMNTMLIEFEGMFPYKKYPQIASQIAFSAEQIEGIRRTCATNHVSIIPLVQSLGHAYSVLRHPEFAHLRELPNTTQQYCPCNPQVKTLYFDLIEEVLAAFGKIEYFHIGGDESKRLAKCPTCQEKYNKMGMSALYGDHINQISRYLLARQIKPIVWSDIIEKHPEILQQLDQDIAILYWNYDIVAWPRPYLMEFFTGKGREVIGGSAAKFGSHSDYMFLYKKSMRNISLMASECLRNGLKGVVVTDWMKLAPTEVGIIATTFGAETSWNRTMAQEEFGEKFARLYFGIEIKELNDIFHLLSEVVIRKEDRVNSHWSAPYSETEGMFPDSLDRFDVSGPFFVQTLIKHTAQEQAEKSVPVLKEAIKRALKALELIEKYENRVRSRKTIFGVLRAAAETQLFNSRMGLAFDKAVRLLKYPKMNEKSERLAVAAELRQLASDWEKTKARVYNTLLPGTFKEILDNAIDYKFSPIAVKYLRGYAKLLETDNNLQGLVNFKVYE